MPSVTPSPTYYSTNICNSITAGNDFIASLISASASTTPDVYCYSYRFGACGDNQLGTWSVSIPTCCEGNAAMTVTFINSTIISSTPTTIGSRDASLYGKLGYAFKTVGTDVNCQNPLCTLHLNSGSSATYSFCIKSTYLSSTKSVIQPGYYAANGANGKELHSIYVPNVCGC